MARRKSAAAKRRAAEPEVAAVIALPALPPGRAIVEAVPVGRPRKVRLRYKTIPVTLLEDTVETMMREALERAISDGTRVSVSAVAAEAIEARWGRGAR